MNKTVIDYSKLVDEAMFSIVKKSLSILANVTDIGDHHFLISFLTQHPDVILSDKLKDYYPKEMTIVLQYQFENLIVNEDNFSVNLSFSGTKENIQIPFTALTAFADPSVKFGLQFSHVENHLSNFPEALNHSSAKKEKSKNEEVLVPRSQNNIIKLDFKNRSVIS